VKPAIEMKESSRQHYISDSLFAEAIHWAGRTGRKDEAMAWPERAYEEHDQWMVYRYPGWDDLRFKPRFPDCHL